ncbi:MAG: tRNA pseudouridine(13) synthase TruD [Anaerolineae bacterium]
MNPATPLPYLTPDLPGTGGQIKSVPADFCVEEIPRYAPGGQGQHIYLTFQKTGLTTLQAINMIARALNVRRRNIGYAGLKDSHAITQQTISIDSAPPEKVAQLSLPGIKIISVNRHRNKLKLGHLLGNKFVIRIRRVGPEATALAEPILNCMQAQGVPNYFGHQRFGIRNNTHRLGLAIIQNNPAQFLTEFLGNPHPQENPLAQQARRQFDLGRRSEALAAWPPMLRQERAVLQRLVSTGDETAALNALDKRLKRLFVSACQSHLFNQLLAQRIGTLSTVEPGDVAYIHQKGACFVVKSAAAEQPRADRFEISPAGPLFGSKYLPAEGEPGDREAAILKTTGVLPADFNVPGVNLGGGRRPYRVPLKDVEYRCDDDGLVLSFALPPGSYATVALREVMKAGKPAPL